MPSKFQFCEKCPIHFNPILPEGSSNPDIYFIAETPGAEEVVQGRPLIGPSGQILRAAIKELGIENYRLFNVCACRAETPEGANRNPTAEEIANCSSNFALLDIRKTLPKVIVPLGASALKAFNPSLSEGITKARSRTYLYEDIPVIPTFHPSYILRGGGLASPLFSDFKNDIERAFKLATEPPQSLSEIREKEETFPIFSYKSVDEFIDFVETELADEPMIGLDYEGSSLQPLSADFKLGGMSLSGRTSGAYLWFILFEDHSPDKELYQVAIEKVAKLLSKLDDQKRLCVYNLKYEIPASYSVFKVDLHNVIDVMQYTIPLNAKASLKDVARLWLRAPEWEAKVSTYVEKMNYILRWLKPTKRYRRKEEILLNKEDGEGIFDLLGDLEERSKDKTDSDGNTIVDDKAKTFYEALQHIGIYHDYPLIGDYLRSKVASETFEMNYTELPLSIVAPYCVKDSMYTVQLYYMLKSELEKKNLLQAAKYYNQHIYLGAQMESAGCRWDDEEAERIDQEYAKEAIECLRNFLLIPKIIRFLNLTEQNIIDIQSTVDLDILKGFFNPETTTKANTQKLSQMMITARVRSCLLAYSIFQSFEADETDARKQMPNLVPWMLDLYHAEDKQAYFATAANNLRDLVGSKRLLNEEAKRINHYTDYQLETADATTIDVVINATLKFMGADIEKPSELPDDIKVIFYHKFFKKLNKTRGTFLNGKVGRQAVSVISSQIDNPTYPVRLREYSPLAENEIYLWNPSLNVNGTVTRRWSSGSHNIPPSSSIRKCFRSKYHNGLVIHCDYSQNELIVLAAMAGDEAMLEAFRRGADIHKFTASIVFGKDEKDVESWERSWAKNANFSLVYQKTVANFADEYMNGDLARAKWLFETLYSRFPDIKRWMEERKSEAKKRGFVKTIWGDDIPIIYDPTSRTSVAEAERTAVNYPVQGSASNIAALSIARVNNFLTDNNYISRCFMFTHDSMSIDAKAEELFVLGSKIPQIAESLPMEEFGLPIRLDIAVGINMYDMVKLKGIGGKPVFLKDSNGDYILHAEYEGERKAVEMLIKTLMPFVDNATCDILESGTEDQYTSYKRVFALKGGLEGGIGQTKTVSKGTIFARQI